MSLELKAMKNFLSVVKEFPYSLQEQHPRRWSTLIKITCEKANCQRCTITFRSDKTMSCSALVDEYAALFCLLCVGHAKEAQKENLTFGRKKVKSGVSKRFDDWS